MTQTMIADYASYVKNDEGHMILSQALTGNGRIIKRDWWFDRREVEVMETYDQGGVFIENMDIQQRTFWRKARWGEWRKVLSFETIEEAHEHF